MASEENSEEFNHHLTEEDMDPNEAVFSEVEDDDDDDDDDDDGSDEESGGDDDDDNGSEDEESGDDDDEEEEEEGEEEQEEGENQFCDDGGGSESSGDENSEICPICLNRLCRQDIGTPESCDHCFCLECIQEWARNVNTCPVDRQVFRLILARHAGEEKIFQQFPVEDKQSQEEVVEEEEDDPTYCEVCNQANREDRLLLCDGCDLGYHCDCLNPPLADVPVDEWFCPTCQAIRGDAAEILTREHRRQIARTRVSERVRRMIQDARVERMERRRRIILDSTSDEEQATSTTMDPGPSSSTTTSTARTSPAKRRSTTPRGTKRKVTRRKRAAPKRKKRKTTTTSSSSTGKKKRKRKRKSTKKGKGKKSARTKKYQAVTPAMPAPSSVKGRIADRLGLSKPPIGWSIPLKKTPSGAGPGAGGGAGAGGGGGRSDNALPSSLSILGNKDELYHFADQEGEEREIVSRPSIPAKSLLSSSAKMSHVPLPLFPAKRKIIVAAPPAAVPTTSTQSAPAPFDLLGSILQNQEMLTKSSRHVTINRDGTLSATSSSVDLSSPKKSSSQSARKDSSGESGSKSSYSSSGNTELSDRNIFDNLSGDLSSSIQPSRRTDNPSSLSSSRSNTNVSNGTGYNKHGHSSSTNTAKHNNHDVRNDYFNSPPGWNHGYNEEDFACANSTHDTSLDNDNSLRLDEEDHHSIVEGNGFNDDTKSDEDLVQCVAEIENIQHGDGGVLEEEEEMSGNAPHEEEEEEEPRTASTSSKQKGGKERSDGTLRRRSRNDKVNLGGECEKAEREENNNNDNNNIRFDIVEEKEDMMMVVFKSRASDACCAEGVDVVECSSHSTGGHRVQSSDDCPKSLLSRDIRDVTFGHERDGYRLMFNRCDDMQEINESRESMHDIEDKGPVLISQQELIEENCHKEYLDSGLENNIGWETQEQNLASDSAALQIDMTNLKAPSHDAAKSSSLDDGKDENQELSFLTEQHRLEEGEKRFPSSFLVRVMSTMESECHPIQDAMSKKEDELISPVSLLEFEKGAFVDKVDGLIKKEEELEKQSFHEEEEEGEIEDNNVRSGKNCGETLWDVKEINGLGVKTCVGLQIEEERIGDDELGKRLLKFEQNGGECFPDKEVGEVTDSDEEEGEIFSDDDDNGNEKEKDVAQMSDEQEEGEIVDDEDEDGEVKEEGVVKEQETENRWKEEESLSRGEKGNRNQQSGIKESQNTDELLEKSCLLNNRRPSIKGDKNEIDEDVKEKEDEEEKLEDEEEDESEDEESDDNDEEEFDPYKPSNGSFQIGKFLNNLVTNEFDRKKEAAERREERRRLREEERNKRKAELLKAENKEKELSTHKISIQDFLGDDIARFGVPRSKPPQNSGPSRRGQGRGMRRGSGRYVRGSRHSRYEKFNDGDIDEKRRIEPATDKQKTNRWTDYGLMDERADNEDFRGRRRHFHNWHESIEGHKSRSRSIKSRERQETGRDREKEKPKVGRKRSRSRSEVQEDKELSRRPRQEDRRRLSVMKVRSQWRKQRRGGGKSLEEGDENSSDDDDVSSSSSSSSASDSDDNGGSGTNEEEQEEEVDSGNSSQTGSPVLQPPMSPPPPPPPPLAPNQDRSYSKEEEIPRVDKQGPMETDSFQPSEERQRDLPGHNVDYDDSHSSQNNSHISHRDYQPNNNNNNVYKFQHHQHSTTTYPSSIAHPLQSSDQGYQHPAHPSPTNHIHPGAGGLHTSHSVPSQPHPPIHNQHQRLPMHPLPPPRHNQQPPIGPPHPYPSSQPPPNPAHPCCEYHPNHPHYVYRQSHPSAPHSSVPQQIHHSGHPEHTMSGPRPSGASHGHHPSLAYSSGPRPPGAPQTHPVSVTPHPSVRPQAHILSGSRASAPRFSGQPPSAHHPSEPPRLHHSSAAPYYHHSLQPSSLSSTTPSRFPNSQAPHPAYRPAQTASSHNPHFQPPSQSITMPTPQRLPSTQHIYGQHSNPRNLTPYNAAFSMTASQPHPRPTHYPLSQSNHSYSSSQTYQATISKAHPATNLPMTVNRNVSQSQNASASTTAGYGFSLNRVSSAPSHTSLSSYLTSSSSRAATLVKPILRTSHTTAAETGTGSRYEKVSSAADTSQGSSKMSYGGVSPPAIRGVATSDRLASNIMLDEVKKRFKQLVEDAVRSALRSAWSNRKISKELYKDIFKKCVEKVCGSKETVVQQDKIQSLVDAYVAKARKAAAKVPT